MLSRRQLQALVRHRRRRKDYRSNQKTIYNLLFRASAAALQQLALAPRFVGAHLGMVGVLHTWTRQLLYHPHVHYIVTGGGLTADGRWRSSGPDFLVPVKVLARIFRAKLRDALKQTALFAQVEPRLRPTLPKTTKKPQPKCT
jgi:putative transposase